MQEFKKNDRVRWSEKGKTTLNPPDPDRLGTVCANPRNPSHVGVRWDGSKAKKYAFRYSSDFIEKTL